MDVLTDINLEVRGHMACFYDSGNCCDTENRISSSSSIKYVAVTFIDALILVMLLMIYFIRSMFRRTRMRSSTQRVSLSQFCSVLYNGCLGIAYVILGSYKLIYCLKKKGTTIFLYSSLPVVFHGLIWTISCLTLSFRGGLLGKTFVKAWLIVSAVSSVFLSIVSSWEVALDGSLRAKPVLDIMSLPGVILLIICALRGQNDADVDVPICNPLLTPHDSIVESCSNITPYSTAGFLNKLTFWWMNSLMKKGYEKPLEERDIPCLCDADKAESRYYLFMEELSRQGTSPSIFWAIVYCHWQDILVSGFCRLVEVIMLSSGPVVLNSFIKFAERDDGSKFEGYSLVLVLFAVKLLESLAQRHCLFRSRTLGIRIKSLLSAAIYRKQLRLSHLAKRAHSSGQITSYVTVDAYRIGEFPFYMHQPWSTSLQLGIALIILYNAVGLATISSLSVVVLTVILNMPVAKMQHKFQSRLMEAHDRRVKAMAEALVSMKVLKLYAWEVHFKSVIQQLRKVELKCLSAIQMRNAYNSFLFCLSPILVSIATFMTCYLSNIPLDASKVFTCIATLRLVQGPVQAIPVMIGAFVQSKVALLRIINFLEAPELQNICRKKTMNNVDCPIVIDSASFSWEEKATTNSLKNVTLKVKNKDKVAICGEVGSGKSTLLAAVLGEIMIMKGMIQVSGKIAYVSQSAWITTGTIQENILFGAAMDRSRYQETLERCSLIKDLDMLPFGDLTEIGEKGVNLSGGQKQRLQLARALYQDADIYLLDDPFSAVDAHTATSLFIDYVMGALSQKTVLLVTHHVHFLHEFDYILLMSDGEFMSGAPYSDLMTTSSKFRNLVNAHRETIGSSKMGTISSHDRNQQPANDIKYKSFRRNQVTIEDLPSTQLIRKEESEGGKEGLKPFLQYLSQSNGYLYLGIGILCHIVYAVAQILQNAWMAANIQNPRVSRFRLIMVYFIIGCCTSFVLLLRAMMIVVLGIEASKSLFSALLNSIFSAPMSFFDSTPLGRILSRVSGDMTIVDIDVPLNLFFSIASALSAYSNLGVLAVITWQVLFVSIPVVYLSVKLQRYYVASAKEFMRINGTTKSLVANHLGESVAGVVTIRAFQEEERFFVKNLELIDRNASPSFHNWAAVEWLLQRLETMCAFVLSTSALVMTLLPQGTFSPGFIGMALSYGLSLNVSLIYAAKNQCNITGYIISVERLNQYVSIPSEAPRILEESRPDTSWPSVGKIEIQDLKIRYRRDTPLVLHGISCTFEGGHNIGIVGRTGSGKTTLISALFRIVEPAGGRILIDGLDIATIGLHDLRSRLAIIPQDPTLFNGTIRYNLDPLGTCTDESIWEVLKKCQLSEAVQEYGLDSHVAEDGSNWSLGQRQLFCLCRALLRRNQIVILDEATASIDNVTDLVLQKIIRSEFASSTVITVAHRIPTVMDCTMVLAITDGKLAEYDEPKKLMQSERSLFGQLVKEYWSRNANEDVHSINES